MSCTRSCKSLNELIKLLWEGNSFLISSHVNPDGDSLGAQLALYSLLVEMGKEVRVVNTDPVPWLYDFLPFKEAIERPAETVYEPDYLIVLDAGSLERIGAKLAKSIAPRKGIINIDHHAESVPFGDYNFIDTSASATSEIIHRLIKEMGFRVGRERAICLYTGIMTDTGSFRFPNTTPRCHIAAAELIAEGVDVQRIYELVYERMSYGRLKLLGEVLNTLRVGMGGRAAWMTVRREMFERTGTGLEDLEGFVNYARSIEGVEVAALFVELEGGRTKVSLRSRGKVNVARIAAAFGGGGHERAAGCLIEAPLEPAMERVLNAIGEVLSRDGLDTRRNRPG